MLKKQLDALEVRAQWLYTMNVVEKSRADRQEQIKHAY